MVAASRTHQASGKTTPIQWQRKGQQKASMGKKNWKHKDILRKEDGKRRERKRAIVALVGSGYEGIEKPVRLKLHVMQRFCDKVTT